MGDRIKHFYKGERLDEGKYEDVSEAFIISDSRLPNYIHVLLNNELNGAIYSGKASGWLINEIPEEFDPAEATIKVTWGTTSSVNDENLETFEWQLSPEAQVSIENASGTSEQNNSTVEI